MKLKINEEIIVPEDVDISVDKGIINVKSKKGELELKFSHPNVKLFTAEGKLKFVSEKASKREKRLIGTYKAHINNMIKGTKEGYEYKLKICSSHFPMTVSLQNNAILIKNYLGEKIPRKAKILEGVDVKVEGDEIILTGISKEKLGQTAANIEKSCKATNRDRRRFSDGIWIFNKAGKKLG